MPDYILQNRIIFFRLAICVRMKRMQQLCQSAKSGSEPTAEPGLPVAVPGPEPAAEPVPVRKPVRIASYSLLSAVEGKYAGQAGGCLAQVPGGCHPPCFDTRCKERYEEGLLWAGRGMIPVNELA